MNRFRDRLRKIENALPCPMYRSKGWPHAERPYGGFQDVYFQALTLKRRSQCRSALGSAAPDWADTGVQADRYRLQVARLRLLWCVGRAFDRLWFSGGTA